MEFVAKNVGIRRAQGRWILPQAMDTILSGHFWDFVYSGGLDTLHRKMLHRMFRVDASAPIPDSIKRPEDVTRFMHSVSNKIWVQVGAKTVRSLDSPEAAAIFDKVINETEAAKERWTEACGDFQLMHRDLWWWVRGYYEAPTYGHFDSILQFNLEYLHIRTHVFRPPMLIYHQYHKSDGFHKRLNKFQVTDFIGLTQDRHGVCRRDNPNKCSWGASSVEFEEDALSDGPMITTRRPDPAWWWPFNERTKPIETLNPTYRPINVDWALAHS